MHGSDMPTKTTTETMSNARGIRNNNPGNIRKDGSVWRGEVAAPEKSFKTFETMA